MAMQSRPVSTSGTLPSARLKTESARKRTAARNARKAKIGCMGVLLSATDEGGVTGEDFVEAVWLVVDCDVNRPVVVAVGRAGDPSVAAPVAGVRVDAVREPDLLAAVDQELVRRNRLAAEYPAGAVADY